MGMIYFKLLDTKDYNSVVEYLIETDMNLYIEGVGYNRFLISLSEVEELHALFIMNIENDLVQELDYQPRNMEDAIIYLGHLLTTRPTIYHMPYSVN